MLDQAVGLRKMAAEYVFSIKQQDRENAAFINWSQDIIAHERGKTICVCSGKGGVGKTQISTNLAVAMGRNGKDVILFDADLGMANVDVVLGLNPKSNLKDVVLGIKTLNDIMVPGPGGIRIIPASSGLELMANLDVAALRNLTQAFNDLNGTYDYLIIDTGAGISRTVTSFINSADYVLVVTVPEPAAMIDAYAVIKVIAKNKGQANLFFNMCNYDTAIENFQKLEKLAKKFLNFRVNYFGHAPVDKNLKLCIKRQCALFDYNPESLFARQVKLLARNITINGFFYKQVENTSFFNRFINFFSRGAL